MLKYKVRDKFYKVYKYLANTYTKMIASYESRGKN